MGKNKTPKSEPKQSTASQDVEAAIKRGDIPASEADGFRKVADFADQVRGRR